MDLSRERHDMEWEEYLVYLELNWLREERRRMRLEDADQVRRRMQWEDAARDAVERQHMGAEELLSESWRRETEVHDMVVSEMPDMAPLRELWHRWVHMVPDGRGGWVEVAVSGPRGRWRLLLLFV